MTIKDDGGPAFSNIGGWIEEDQYGKTQKLVVIRERDKGMSLRDWFAGNSVLVAAMLEEESPTHGTDGPTYKGIAARAYLIADAMLEARK